MRVLPDDPAEKDAEPWPIRCSDCGGPVRRGQFRCESCKDAPQQLAKVYRMSYELEESLKMVPLSWLSAAISGWATRKMYLEAIRMAPFEVRGYRQNGKRILHLVQPGEPGYWMHNDLPWMLFAILTAFFIGLGLYFLMRLLFRDL